MNAERAEPSSSCGLWLLAACLLSMVCCPRLIPDAHHRYAYRGKARADITAIRAAAEEYARNHGGRYPDDLETLVTPDVSGHTYLGRKTVPLDPWKRPYLYDPPGPDQPEPRVYTNGPDGRRGGEGKAADIDDPWRRDEWPFTGSPTPSSSLPATRAGAAWPRCRPRGRA
jgi:hypothetical protein